jgi:tetratricopeptide (TPR) repeat protein
VQGAAVGAAIFGLHPIHTEAVTGIVGRAELLMSLAMLGALLLAIKQKVGWSLAVFSLGLFAKEQTVMLPAVIVLYDLCKKPRAGPPSRRRRRTPREPLFSRADLVRYGSYGLVLFAYLIVRGIALGGLALAPAAFLDNPLAYVDTWERVLTAFKVAGYYLWLSLWPASLSADYSYNAVPIARSLLEPGVAFGVLSWGALTWLMARAYRTGDRRIAFAIGLTLLGFLPVSNLLVAIGTIMGERLFYLPSAGLCLLAALGYEAVKHATCDVRSSTFPASTSPSPPYKGGVFNVERRTSHLARMLALARTSHVAPFLVIAICLALAGRTIARNLDWENDHTLFRSAEKAVPTSAKIQAYVGRVFQGGHEWDNALRHYQTALTIYPAYMNTDASINVNIGDVYFKLGQLEKAVEALERAIRLAPSSPEAHYNLGLVYGRLGRYAEAEPMVRKALALRQAFPEAHNTLSRLLVETRRYDAALAEADAAIEIRPTFPEAFYNRGLALQGLGRDSEANEAFAKAMKE